MTKIPVVILGATGTVGQRFVQLLSGHPFFEITALAASERNIGNKYTHACRWLLPGDMPADIGEMVIQAMNPDFPARLVFSALPAKIAGKIEPRFAQAGYAVFSNASSFRYEPDVPILIPEVNASHLDLIYQQQAGRKWSGFIVTNPNCTTTGIAIALKPLDQAFGLKRVFVATMQAVSGAGYPGVASMDILDNILPHIEGEEEKIEKETRLLLGHIENNQQIEADILVSAQANRVPVLDGHVICLSMGFEKKPTIKDALAKLTNFCGIPKNRKLPSAPKRPLIVRHELDRPQPRLDRDSGAGLAVTVGRIRPCPLLDLRLVVVVHNTIRGAAAGSILNAELWVDSQKLK